MNSIIETKNIEKGSPIGGRGALPVMESFYTIQGEGFHSGRAAVFLRFSGCNLWSGREEDRAKAKCKFCDTDFVGIDGENGGKYNAAELAELVYQQWPISNSSNKNSEKKKELFK